MFCQLILFKIFLKLSVDLFCFCAKCKKREIGKGQQLLRHSKTKMCIFYQSMNARFNCCLITEVITDIETQLCLHVLSYLSTFLYLFSWLIRNKFFFLSDLSAVRHFIATDRKGTLSSNRKTSAPAELSILDREDYTKNTLSSRSITRASCPQVTSVFPHPDICPRYSCKNILYVTKKLYIDSSNFSWSKNITFYNLLF